MVRDLTDDGVTVLLTTQYLEEADQLADDIVVIDRGAVVATGTPDDLKARAGAAVLQMRPHRAPGRCGSWSRDRRRARRRHAEVDQDTVVGPAGDDALCPRVVRRLDDVGVRARRADAAARHPRRGLPRPHRPPRPRTPPARRPGAGVTIDRTAARPPAADVAAPRVPTRRVTPGRSGRPVDDHGLAQPRPDQAQPLRAARPRRSSRSCSCCCSRSSSAARSAASTDAYLQFALRRAHRAERAVPHPLHRPPGWRPTCRRAPSTGSAACRSPARRRSPGGSCATTVRQLWSLVVLLAVGVVLGFRITTSPLAVLAAFGLLVGVHRRVLVDLGAARRAGRATRRRCRSSGSRVLFPLTLRQQRVRARPRRCRTGCRPGCRSTP